MEHKEDSTAPRRIKVTDRRISSGEHVARGEANPPPAPADAAEFSPEDVGAGNDAEAVERDTQDTVPLEDYKRLQADFDNRRKRLMREADAGYERGKISLFKALLPVLDNYDRALEHEDDSSALGLLHKEMVAALASEGLEEIPAEGLLFDPNVHEAIEARPDPEVTEIVIKTVYRKGYHFKDKVLRAATVVVSRPVEDDDAGPERAQG